MPVHGLRADLELVALTVSAALVSYFLTSQLVSNVMFTILIAGLFFLEGLHLDLGFTGDIRERSKQYLLGLLSIYLVAPLVALGFGIVFPSLQDLLLLLGISAAALGSPRVWSNLSKADGKLAGRLGSLSLVLSLFMVPALIAVLPLDINLAMLMRNAVLAVIPFAAGIGLKSYRSSWVEDARIHFSKLCFWLIVLITLVQFEFILSAGHPEFLGTTAEAGFILLGFSVGLYIAGYMFAKAFDHYEKEARAIGFAAGSKNVAVAFLLASMVGAEEIALVGVYYFIRQFVGIGITDFHSRGTFKLLERLGLKDS